MARPVDVAAPCTRIAPAEPHFRALYDYSMDAILVARPDGRIVSANPAACELFCLSEEGLRRIGRDGVLDATDPALHELLETRRRTGHARGEVRARRGDGSSFIAEISSVIFWDDAGVEHTSITLRDVTARQRAQEQLQANERLLQMTTRIARVGGWEVDLRSGRMTWSDEVCRIHAVPPGTSVSVEAGIEYYAPEWRARIREVFAACVNDGIPYDEEVQILNAAGERAWVRTMGEAIRDSDGAIYLVQGAFQDISERKRIEYELLQSRDRFRQMADAMPVSIWTAEPEGTFDYMNEAFCRYIGIEAGAPAAWQWINAVHADDRLRLLTSWLENSQSANSFLIEVRVHRARDQSTRWHLVSATTVRDDAGEVVKWVGTAIDIHDRKVAEKQVARLSDSLRDTLESMTDAFFTVDRNWCFVYVNPQAETLLRHSRSELIGKSIWQTFPALLGLSFEDHYRQAMATGHAAHFTALYPPLDIWIDAHVYPSAEGLAIYLRDITEQHRLEEQIRRSQRLEAIGQLTGGVAHDFNNLLMGILSSAQVLEKQLAGDGSLYEAARIISRAAERGAQLTRKLLTIGRQQLLTPALVDINELVAGLDGLLRQSLGRDIRFEIRSAEALWPAFVDNSELEVALLNLCVNARDAMEGTGTLLIETANARLDRAYAGAHKDATAGDYVLITVSDTGTGIAPDIMSKIFEPFFTTKEIGKGTGLGLSMVYGFIKQSGGHIDVCSKPGHGTAFKLYLPRAGDVPASKPHEAAAVKGA